MITRDMEASESSHYVRGEEDDDILTVSKEGSTEKHRDD